MRKIIIETRINVIVIVLIFLLGLTVFSCGIIFSIFERDLDSLKKRVDKAELTVLNYENKLNSLSVAYIDHHGAYPFLMKKEGDMK